MPNLVEFWFIVPQYFGEFYLDSVIFLSFFETLTFKSVHCCLNSHHNYHTSQLKYVFLIGGECAITGRKTCALKVPPVVPYKALEKFSKALYGTTGGTYNACVFHPVMTCHGSKLTNSFWKQHLDISTHTWSGHAPWNHCKFVSHPSSSKQFLCLFCFWV